MSAEKTLIAWVVDDDESIRWVIEKALTRAGMDVTTFPGAGELLDALAESTPDVLLSDIRMPGVNGLELLQKVKAKVPDLPVIIMTAHSDLDAAVTAYQGGAFEYLPKPFDVHTVSQLVRRAAQTRLEKPAAAEPKQSNNTLIGEAPAMQEVFRAIGRLSQSQITVLITGETGSGKEVVARALHNHSPRAGKTFVAVNTAAIPKDLMESEFFGHEKGAFTGAVAQRRGRFEQADGGTLFLDEIGDMPMDLQTRLLRVLADGEFYRVGGHAPVKVDVRVIAATHQKLETAVKEGRFREDLFHRLNVIRVRIPSLNERREDIPPLAQHFLARAAIELKTEPKRIAADVWPVMKSYHWPGNVRQLENACRWLTVMAPGQDVHVADLPPELLSEGVADGTDAQGAAAEIIGNNATTLLSAETQVQNISWPQALANWAKTELASGRDDLLALATADFEKVLIEQALHATGGQRIEAAKRLGWGRNTLTRKIKELELDDL